MATGSGHGGQSALCQSWGWRCRVKAAGLVSPSICCQKLGPGLRCQSNKEDLAFCFATKGETGDSGSKGVILPICRNWGVHRVDSEEMTLGRGRSERRSLGGKCKFQGHKGTPSHLLSMLEEAILVTPHCHFFFVLFFGGAGDRTPSLTSSGKPAKAPLPSLHFN